MVRIFNLVNTLCKVPGSPLQPSFRHLGLTRLYIPCCFSARPACSGFGGYMSITLMFDGLLLASEARVV